MIWPNPHDPYDIELGYLAIVTADLLAREMDDVFLDLIHTSGPDRHSPHHAMAVAANCIVVRCRRLVEDIHRYERYNNVRRLQEEENLRKQEEDEPDIPDEVDIPF